MTDSAGNTWSMRLGYGNLNRKRNADNANTVAPVKTLYREVELGHRRRTRFGDFNLGLGYDYRENTITGEDKGLTRVFAEWVYSL